MEPSIMNDFLVNDLWVTWLILSYIASYRCKSAQRAEYGTFLSGCLILMVGWYINSPWLMRNEFMSFLLVIAVSLAMGYMVRHRAMTN
jgi:hypothetical protein